jgi:hypothetical protein
VCDYLDAKGLVVWFMDDGGRNSEYGSGMVIDISSFASEFVNIETREAFSQGMYNRFGIETSFHLRSAQNIKMYIKAKSALHFCDLVRPFVIETMKYKLTK